MGANDTLVCYHVNSSHVILPERRIPTGVASHETSLSIYIYLFIYIHIVGTHRQDIQRDTNGGRETEWNENVSL